MPNGPGPGVALATDKRLPQPKGATVCKINLAGDGVAVMLHQSHWHMVGVFQHFD